MTWQHFSYESDPKLACSCCGHQGMDDDFMKRIDLIRAECGFAFVVTSGYRCPEYNQQVSSTGKSGPHTTGRAIDIAIHAASGRYKLIDVAMRHGISRFGIGKDFVHLDDLGIEQGFNEQRIWRYP